MKRTIDEFAEELDVPREEAEGLVRFLRKKGLVLFRGERPAVNGGKGAHVYEVMSGAGKMLGAMVGRLE